jgi:hypothetical protein
LQDSIEDWEETAATMADIYEHAYITIAATHSQDSESGLFSSDRIVTHRLRKHPDLYVKQIPPIFPSAYPDWNRNESQRGNRHLWLLLSRARVYQERRLSPRIVHFGRHQIYGNANITLHQKIDFTTVGPAHLGAGVNASIVLKVPVITLTDLEGLSSDDIDDLEHFLYYPSEFFKRGLATFGLTRFRVNIDYDLMTAKPLFTTGTVIKSIILQIRTLGNHWFGATIASRYKQKVGKIDWLNTCQLDDAKAQQLQWKRANFGKSWDEEAPYDDFFDSLPWEEMKVV